jgi:hypothetical protein
MGKKRRRGKRAPRREGFPALADVVYNIDPWDVLQQREAERVKVAAEVAADLRAAKADSAWTRMLKYLGLG